MVEITLLETLVIVIIGVLGFIGGLLFMMSVHISKDFKELIKSKNVV